MGGCCKCVLKKEWEDEDDRTSLQKHVRLQEPSCTKSQYAAALIPLSYLRNGEEKPPRDKPLFTAAQAKKAEYTVEDMLVAGYTAAELKAAQYTAAQLKEEGTRRLT